MKKLPLSGECALHSRKGTKTAGVLSCCPSALRSGWSGSAGPCASSLEKQVTQCTLPGEAGTSPDPPATAVSVLLPPGGHLPALWAQGRDTDFDANCMQAWNPEASHATESQSPQCSPATHTLLFTHTEKSGGCCGHQMISGDGTQGSGCPGSCWLGQPWWVCRCARPGKIGRGAGTWATEGVCMWEQPSAGPSAPEMAVGTDVVLGTWNGSLSR